MLPKTLEISTARTIGAKKLKNGGVIYEMDSKETASWIREEKEAFMANFSGNAIVKERVVSMIAEYVPTSHTTDSPTELRKIEMESNIDTGSLVSSRWIKPIHKRKKGQLTAHTILRFTSPELANKAIDKGLIIAGKRIQTWRLRREPCRCLKCQLVNTQHMAAECKSTNICGTCGKEHCTADCDKSDPANYSCTNCKGANHAS